MRCFGRYLIIYAVTTNSIANGGIVIGGTLPYRPAFFPIRHGTESHPPTTSRHSATGHPPIVTEHIAAPRATVRYQTKVVATSVAAWQRANI